MAENINALILPIGADPTQFQKSINDVKNSIKELGSTISATPFNLVTTEQKNNLAQLQNTLKTLTNDLKEFGKAAEPAANSIAGLDKKIKELNAKKITLDAKTSALEIVNLNKEIERLTEKRNNIDALGASVQKVGQVGGNSFKRLEDSSKKTRTALTSLSLVAQDLPFGFIAIQNNLPNLIQAFGQLDTKTRGFKVVFGELRNALVGPAGIFLAFSVVTSAVTFAVQKYGSLGAAVDALFGKIDPLKDLVDRVNKSFEEYNKQAKSTTEINNLAQKSNSGLLETVRLLTNGATDLSLSEKERGQYLNQLKEIDKDYFGNLTTGANSVDLIKKATDKYTESLIANARVKAFQSELDAIDAQIVPLEILREEYKKNAVEAEKLRKTSTKLFVDPTEKVTKSLDENAAAIENLYQKRELLKAGLEEAINAFKGFIKPQNDVKDSILEINSVDLTGYYSIESILNRIKDAANRVLDTTLPLKDRISALKEIKNEDQEYFKNLNLGTNSLNEIKNATEEYLHILQILGLEQKGRLEASKLQQQADKNAANALKERIDEQKKLEKDFFAQADKEMNINADAFFKQSMTALESVTGELDKLQKSFIATKDILTSVFFNPLQELFTNFLENGKFTFQEFAKSVLNSIKKIVAQFAATQIIQLLAQFLNPMGAIASTGILNNPSGQLGRRDRGLQGALSRILIGQSMNPNIGSIQRPLAQGGTVNFVIRGTELVGVLNRGNQEISRIG